ncbi:MAG: UDP-N-acetylmuramoyl-L-alanine--D-glutamate ligase [Ghiorsea sp.]|nr:UDP-N-acetylmuramoyl-L-alanine--D-glutamate ligase [Ghiorsea sp.]
MDIQQEKVAVIGMGKTGLSAVRYLQRKHIACECFDEANVTLPEDMKDIVLHTGELNAKLLGSFDRVIVSPGIDWRHPVLAAVRACDVPVHGDLEEFLREYTGTLITVTGTNGKTTVTQMVGLLLETLSGGCDAGGNIGTPMLDLLANKQPERVVLELSSFQLERAQGLHPHLAILLNIQPDHADMHESPLAYRKAKMRMFEHMIVGDKAMLPLDMEWKSLVDDLSQRGVSLSYFGVMDENDTQVNQLAAGVLHRDGNQEEAKMFWTQDAQRHFIPCNQLMVKGFHQQQNIAVAAQVAADYGVSKAVIEEAMMSFQGLEHRLEFVGNIEGKDWFNDSKATNPDAAGAALSSFDKVVWICGGLRKELDLGSLTKTVQKHVMFACVVGKDAKAYEQLLKQAGVPYTVSKTIPKAVKDAAKQHCNAVLLSPAAASQDQFSNYAERGEVFVKSIRELTDG